jgi:hypothetical protein
MVQLAREAPANRMQSARPSTKCSIVFESSASAGLKLVVVPADEIFVYGPHSIRRRNKTAYGKTFERGNKEFQSSIGKRW